MGGRSPSNRQKAQGNASVIAFDLDQLHLASCVTTAGYRMQTQSAQRVAGTDPRQAV